MINDRNQNNMMYFNQIKQNNSYLAYYKGSTRLQIGQKWVKMGQNSCFSELFGYQMQ